MNITRQTAEVIIKALEHSIKTSKKFLPDVNYTDPLGGLVDWGNLTAEERAEAKTKLDNRLKQIADREEALEVMNEYLENLN